MEFSIETQVYSSQELSKIKDGIGELTAVIFDENIVLNKRNENEYGLEITIKIKKDNQGLSVVLKKEDAVLFANQILKLTKL